MNDFLFAALPLTRLDRQWQWSILFCVDRQKPSSPPRSGSLTIEAVEIGFQREKSRCFHDHLAGCGEEDDETSVMLLLTKMTGTKPQESPSTGPVHSCRLATQTAVSSAWLTTRNLLIIIRTQTTHLPTTSAHFFSSGLGGVWQEESSRPRT